MKELSIFVDESGDFGSYKSHSPFYFFTLVFHDQGQPISTQIEFLEKRILELNLPAGHCFHAGPIIRREEDYSDLSIVERRRCLNAITSFARKIDICYKAFFADKKATSDAIHLNKALSMQLREFIDANQWYFNSFDRIIVYYDNGQGELSKILTAVFTVLLRNVEFKKVIPVDYKLFQVADLLCTMELVKKKYELKMQSFSEIGVFGSNRDFNKNYLKPLHKMRFDNKIRPRFF